VITRTRRYISAARLLDFRLIEINNGGGKGMPGCRVVVVEVVGGGGGGGIKVFVPGDGIEMCYCRTLLSETQYMYSIYT